jgi:hypothetical protein
MQVRRADFEPIEIIGMFIVMVASPLSIYLMNVVLFTMLETEKWWVGVGAFFALLFLIPVAIGSTIFTVMVICYSIGRVFTKLSNLF